MSRRRAQTEEELESARKAAYDHDGMTCAACRAQGEERYHLGAAPLGHEVLPTITFNFHLELERYLHYPPRLPKPRPVKAKPILPLPPEGEGE